MKHFYIFVIVALVSAQPPLGDECTVSADCGRQVDNKICVHGKCVLMEPKQRIFHGIVGVQSGIQRSMPSPCEFGWPCRPEDVYYGIGRDFLHTPCPVPCEEFGKVCVRGVCQ